MASAAPSSPPSPSPLHTNKQGYVWSNGGVKPGELSAARTMVLGQSGASVSMTSEPCHRHRRHGCITGTTDKLARQQFDSGAPSPPLPLPSPASSQLKK